MSQENESIPTLENLREELRVLFIHGGGWGKGKDLSKQPFAEYMRSKFVHFHCEAMPNTSEFEKCIFQQANAIISFKPHIIVTKSQGGPTLLNLYHRNIYFGPCVITCPAVVPGIDNLVLSSKVPYLIIGGINDNEARPDLIESLYNKNKIEMNNKYIERIWVNDVHSLKSLLVDDIMTNNIQSDQMFQNEKVQQLSLYQCIEKCWKAYLEMDDSEKTPINQFWANKIPENAFNNGAHAWLPANSNIKNDMENNRNKTKATGQDTQCCILL